MNIEIFEGKTLEETLEKALEELELTEEEIIYKKEEIKGGLFKSDGIKIEVVKLTEINDFIKETLISILNQMDIQTTFESKIRDRKINITMYSDRNSILIGKNGKTLEALQIIVKQIVYNKIGMYPFFSLDVENYKEKQENYLEHLAKRTAREVAKTKVDASLENMNSYERRIVHNCLTNFKNVYTISEGEEPNRYVVIKYKETEENIEEDE